MRYVLTDIEGTTTSVAFVYDVLFPYFKEHIGSFLENNAVSETVSEALEAVRQTVYEEENRTLDSLKDLADQLIHWTNIDRKHTALKSIQGDLWRSAYENGAITGHVYDDVKPALEGWKNAGIGIGIYSSGAVAAQKLLFGYSEKGDLTPYFSHYFDTRIGHKREAASYSAIAATIGLPPGEILFLSDIEAELDAASVAGMMTRQLLRAGATTTRKHPTIKDFSEI